MTLNVPKNHPSKSYKFPTLYRTYHIYSIDSQQNMVFALLLQKPQKKFGLNCNFLNFIRTFIRIIWHSVMANMAKDPRSVLRSLASYGYN